MKEPLYYNSACFVYERVKIMRGRPYTSYKVLERIKGEPGKEIGIYPTKTWAIAVADKMEKKNA